MNNSVHHKFLQTVKCTFAGQTYIQKTIFIRKTGSKHLLW